MYGYEYTYIHMKGVYTFVKYTYERGIYTTYADVCRRMHTTYADVCRRMHRVHTYERGIYICEIYDVYHTHIYI